jgi:hypothetical protein
MFFSAVCVTAASEPTKIKGFFIGMSRNEVAALKPADTFLNDDSYGKDTLRFRTYGLADIAVFVFADDDTLKSFSLQREFFDPGRTLGPQEFVKAALEHYPIQSPQCKSDPDDNVRCEGRTPEGDKVEIVAGRYQTYIVVKAQDRTSPKPSFN